MIYEYAVEPELVVAWGKDRADYRYFCEQFGLGTARIMAEFPKLKNWRRQFRQAAEGADPTRELPRITALFTLLIERRVRRDGYDYDGVFSWLENVESENGRQSFQAILARTNPRHHAKVLAPGFAETNPLWKVEKQSYCSRRAQDMAELVGSMLSNCSTVHFIDPYFGPENPRFRRPLEAFINVIATQRCCRPAIDTITVHTSDRANFAFFRQTCQNQLQHRISAGARLVFQRWKQRDGGEKLHNRYILTDIGGVKFDPGLDDGNEGETVEVIVLERNLYEKHWNDYVENPAFDPAESPFEITGTRRGGFTAVTSLP